MKMYERISFGGRARAAAAGRDEEAPDQVADSNDESDRRQSC